MHDSGQSMKIPSPNLCLTNLDEEKEGCGERDASFDVREM
jgi:hypothetical protein